MNTLVVTKEVMYVRMVKKSKIKFESAKRKTYVRRESILRSVSFYSSIIKTPDFFIR